MQRFRLSIVILVIFLLSTFSAAAQDTVIADGLNNPRGMAYDADGSLYIAETGNAGPETAIGPFGPTAVGSEGQVTVVSASGDKSLLLENLTSMNESDTLGVHAIHVTDDTIWLLLGEGPLSVPFTMGLVEMDRATRRVRNFVDLYTTAVAQHPVDNPSNPTDFAFADDGTIYIANASCNCVQTWKAGEGVSVFLAWDDEDNPVPTTVELGPDGNLYVGFLTGFPFPQNGSRIEVWTTGGELVKTYPGLTAVTNVLVDEMGTIYAVEFGAFGDQGWGPGRVVMVSDDGITPLLEDLTRPWGLVKDPEGNLLVTVGSTGGSQGTVITVPAMSQ